MMMVALVVLGVVSYGRLAIDEYPDVTYPTINVSVSYPGASPETSLSATLVGRDEGASVPDRARTDPARQGGRPS
jgi:hypothetical protein